MTHIVCVCEVCVCVCVCVCVGRDHMLPVKIVLLCLTGCCAVSPVCFHQICMHVHLDCSLLCVYLRTLPHVCSKCVCLCVFVVSGSMDSPMTMVVIWCLLAPCLFFTSQMKVVLTASSTFLTVSLLPSTTTVSGKEPEALQEREREREVGRREGWNTARRRFVEMIRKKKKTRGERTEGGRKRCKIKE